ncbi:hypothetical protein AC249_AIPGENE13758 [Exaiptasia diaphana]|nr:hypothetical protein AC249_AIPGENE13758 [Exaiptasia diaphana]
MGLQLKIIILFCIVWTSYHAANARPNRSFLREADQGRPLHFHNPIPFKRQEPTTAPPTTPFDGVIPFKRVVNEKKSGWLGNLIPFKREDPSSVVPFKRR